MQYHQIARTDDSVTGMGWPKLAILTVLLAIGIAMAFSWHKGAANVVVPVTLVALYAVWRWRRDE